MVCLRCTGAPARIPTLPQEQEEWEKKEKKRGETRGTGARQDGGDSVGEGEASSSSASHSLGLGARDKPLLMEEINFGLNRSPATL